MITQQKRINIINKIETFVTNHLSIYVKAKFNIPDEFPGMLPSNDATLVTAFGL